MTTKEVVIRLARESGFVLFDGATDEAINRFKRLIDLVRAEENEAIIAAANALENIASTSSSTRIRRVANDALTVKV